MSTAPTFEDDIAPDNEQVEDIIRDAFLLLKPPQGDLGMTPAHAWMPLLKEAAAKLEEARNAAVAQLLPDSRKAVKMASYQSINPYRDNAEHYPEVRRVCVVDVALFAVQWAIEDLQNEGRAPVQPEALKLSRTKRTQ